MMPTKFLTGLITIPLSTLLPHGLGTTASASTPDEDVVIPAVFATENTASRTSTARAFTNPAAIPDTHGVIADDTPPLHAQGVMTEAGAEFDSDYGARAFGSFGIPYTTTRVQEGNHSASSPSANRLSTTYPYRTVGKLIFSQGYCSASLIFRSVIVTAAHCIQDFGTGSNVFKNFRFMPAHYGASGATENQKAPYGSYSALSILRPASWAQGNDEGTGAARDNDLALIALRKRNGQFVGSRVGWLGYGWNNYGFVSSPKTGNLNVAAVSSLGYPGLADAGNILQRTDGPTYTTQVGAADQLWQGSNFTGGSSGGPWVVNLRSRAALLSGGALLGTASKMAVVGVTSWGSSNPNGAKDNYASQFRQNTRYPAANYGGYGAGNIGSLLNTLCNSTAPEGGTLASAGYCR